MRPTRPLGALLVLGGVFVAATLYKGAKPILQRIGEKIKDFGDKVGDEINKDAPEAETPKEEATATKTADATTTAEAKAEEPVAKPKAAKAKKAPTKTATRKPKTAPKPKTTTTTGRRRPAGNVETG